LEIIKQLFKKANRTYSKGETDNFIQFLDIKKIEASIYDEIKKLEQVLYTHQYNK